MKNQLSIFSFKNNQLRTLELDNQIWFVAKYVATALQYCNKNKAVQTHVDEEDKESMGGIPKRYINR